MEPGVTQAVVDQITNDVKKFGGDVKSLGDDMRRDLGALRSLIDQHGPKAEALVTEQVGKLSASIETKQLAVETGLKAVQADLEKVNAVLQRPNGVQAGWKDSEEGKLAAAAFDFHKIRLAKTGRLQAGVAIDPATVDVEAYDAWAKNFDLYLRRDTGAVPQAALQTGSDPDGGYSVTTTVSGRIATKVYETSPMRELATVETIMGGEWEMPRDEGEFGAGWTAELTAPSETTTAQLGLSKIIPHELYAAPRATQRMLEDAGFEVENWIGGKVGEKFGRLEATAFVAGTGVGQPRGILSYASGTSNGQIEQIVSGAATAVTFDGLKNQAFALKDGYERNASWLMNRLTLRDVTKLKDGDGRYLWEPNLQVGQPSSLLGYPLRRAADMPTPAASALVIAFGDFKTAYTIVDRLGYWLLRDPFSNKPYVVFYTRRRVGGDVVNFEALKLMVCST